MLASPAPFVYGGSFADYVKEKRKFTRFASLARFSEILESSSSDASTCDSEEQSENDIETLYAQARAQDIGTVSTFDMPQYTMKVVNLVDIVSFIKQQRGEDIDDKEEEEECECEEDEGEEGCVSEEEGLELKYADMLCKGELEVPKPIVYSGTFQEYKQGAARFTRFRTMQAFSTNLAADGETTRAPEEVAPKALALPLDASLTMPSLFDATIEADANMEDKQRVILDVCFSPSQLIALARPPGCTSESSMYVAFSDTAVKNATAATMLGAKAAMSMAMAELDNGADLNDEESSSDEEEETKETERFGFAAPSPSPVKSPYRFNFAASQLEGIGSSKMGMALSFQDDGSNWLVDDSASGTSHALLYKNRRVGHSSASSWGGGGVHLEPIAHGKVSLDQAVKVSMPRIPGRRLSGSFDNVGKSHGVSYGATAPIF